MRLLQWPPCASWNRPTSSFLVANQELGSGGSAARGHLAEVAWWVGGIILQRTRSSPDHAPPRFRSISKGAKERENHTNLQQVEEGIRCHVVSSELGANMSATHPDSWRTEHVAQPYDSDFSENPPKQTSFTALTAPQAPVFHSTCSIGEG